MYLALIKSAKVLSTSEMATRDNKMIPTLNNHKLIGSISDRQVPDWNLDAFPYCCKKKESKTYKYKFHVGSTSSESEFASSKESTGTLLDGLHKYSDNLVSSKGSALTTLSCTLLQTATSSDRVSVLSGGGVDVAIEQTVTKNTD